MAAELKLLGHHALLQHLLPGPAAACYLLSRAASVAQPPAGMGGAPVAAASPAGESAVLAPAPHEVQVCGGSSMSSISSIGSSGSSSGALEVGCELLLALQAACRHLQYSYKPDSAEHLRISHERSAFMLQLLQQLGTPWLLQALKPMTALASIWSHPGVSITLQVRARLGFI